MSAPAAGPFCRVATLVWSRFNVTAFNVTASLPGSVHRFEVNGTPVEVHLPKRPVKPPKPGEFREHDKISCYAWRRNRPTEYNITSVDVLVQTGKKLRVPRRALGTVRHEFFSETERKRMERIATEGQPIANEAFDRWVRTLRWQTLHWFIGQPTIVGPRSGWGTYLWDADTRQRFFSATQTIAVHGWSAVDRKAWKRVGTALARGREVPVWCDFLFEGRHRVWAGDLHGGIVCLGIACEAIIRTLLWKHIRRPVNPQFAELVDFLNIRKVLDNWKDIGYWDAQWQQAMDLPKLKRIVDLRNRVMHRGETTLNSAECSQLALAAHKFIVHASRTAQRLSD